MSLKMVLKGGMSLVMERVDARLTIYVTSPYRWQDIYYDPIGSQSPVAPMF